MNRPSLDLSKPTPGPALRRLLLVTVGLVAAWSVLAGPPLVAMPAEEPSNGATAPADPALPADELAAARDALQAADGAFHRALIARHRDGVELHLAGDVVFLEDEEPRRGKLDFLTLMAPVFEAEHGFSYEGETVSTEVAGSGELGFTIGKIRHRFESPGSDEPRVVDNHTLSVWTREGRQPWKMRVYSTLIVHRELGHAIEPRSALLAAWPELTEQIASAIELEWIPETTIRAASGDMVFTLGSYRLVLGNGTAGGGTFATIWAKDSAGRWQLAAEGYTPPRIPRDS